MIENTSVAQVLPCCLQEESCRLSELLLLQLGATLQCVQGAATSNLCSTGCGRTIVTMWLVCVLSVRQLCCGSVHATACAGDNVGWHGRTCCMWPAWFPWMLVLNLGMFND